MSPDVIQRLLERDVQRTLLLKVGDRAAIPLPRLPLIAETQFLKLEARVDDPGGIMEIETEPAHGEGLLGPTAVAVVGRRSGSAKVVIHAIDRLTGDPVANVRPVEITVSVE